MEESLIPNVPNGLSLPSFFLDYNSSQKRTLCNLGGLKERSIFYAF